MLSPIAGENKKSAALLIHASAWIVYASFIYIANYITRPDIKVLTIVLFLVPHCLTFYVSVYCLQLYSRIGVIWSVAAFFIGFFVMAAIGYCFVYLFLPWIGIVMYSTDSYKEFIKAALLGYVQYFSYAVLYFYADRAIKRQKELLIMREEKLKNELENARLKEQELRGQKDKLQLEYAFLRSQVNPHFLHNTLNVLYNQALNCSEELAGNISKLSRMMRYSMESVEYESDKVPVQKEIDNLELLIQINNIRFEESMVIDYKVQGREEGQMLPPLSMITVVENAFKYGDLKDPLYPLTIRITLEPGYVYFFCRNKKRKTHFEPSSNNIGMTNLSKRLDEAFKGKYKMDAIDEKEMYTFELRIFS
ncbi:MAG TPA: histidine kinase [Chitinophagaceae bacterium]